MNSLVALLHELAADRFTGRVTVRSHAGGWVYVDQGAVSCAERRHHPTLLVEMAQAGLFTEDEWKVALCRTAGTPRWSALVGDDPQRLAELTRVARGYVSSSLSSLAREEDVAVAVATNVLHPFGTLERWSVDELVGDELSETEGVAAAPVDRVEFLEMLEEISPEVRPVGTSTFSIL